MWAAVMSYLIVGEALMAFGLCFPGPHEHTLSKRLIFLFPVCMLVTAIWPWFIYLGIKRGLS